MREKGAKIALEAFDFRPSNFTFFNFVSKYKNTAFHCYVVYTGCPPQNTHTE